ncbi:MAG: hypothetical protein Q4D33_04800 [Prevotellaceae bacterium]|nr:hypothetical protein [Prevotellaceae bacterium]
MQLISIFYTLYLIVYFPTCIAFNTIEGFSSIDEAMTFVLIGFTLLQVRNRHINKEPIREYEVFLLILAFYVGYSLQWGENVAGGVFLEFLQQIRPFSIIFCTWILNPVFTRMQKTAITTTVILTLIVRVFFSNEGAGTQAEVSSGQMAACAGMIWMLFHNETRQNRIIALVLVLLGLFGGTKFKFLGEVVCFIALVFFLKKKIDLKSRKAIYSFVALAILVLASVWSQFSKYYIVGMEDDQVARAETTKVAFGQILWDYIPFGPGMGTFATNGAWRYYSPLYTKYDLDGIWGLNEGGGFICDIFYPSLCQYGLVGIFLFLWFWKRRLSNFNEIRDVKYFRVALMAFLCLAIEQTADSSWLSGKGMGYCMLIGLCLNANRNQQEIIDKQKKRLEQQKQCTGAELQTTIRRNE